VIKPLSITPSLSIGERVRNRILITWERIQTSLQVASEAYQQRLAWEKRCYELSQRVPTQATTRKPAGLLFSTTNEKTLSLYEGLNEIEKNLLKLDGDEISNGDLKIFSNELLILGDRSYFVKILPRKYRIEISGGQNA